MAVSTCGTRPLRPRLTAAKELGGSISEVPVDSLPAPRARGDKSTQGCIPPPTRGRRRPLKSHGGGCLQGAVDKQLCNEDRESQVTKVKATAAAGLVFDVENIQQSYEGIIAPGLASNRKGNRKKAKVIGTEDKRLRVLREMDMPSAGGVAKSSGSQRDAPKRKSVPNLGSSVPNRKPKPTNLKWNKSIPELENTTSDRNAPKRNCLPPPCNKHQTQGERSNRTSKFELTNQQGGGNTRVTRSQTRKRCRDMFEKQEKTNIYTNPQQSSSSRGTLPRYSAKRLLNNIAMAEGICQPLGVPRGTLTADEDRRVYRCGAEEDSFRWKLNRTNSLHTHGGSHGGSRGAEASGAYPSWENLTAWQKECRDLCIERLSPGVPTDHDTFGEDDLKVGGSGPSTTANVGII